MISDGKKDAGDENSKNQTQIKNDKGDKVGHQSEQMVIKGKIKES